MPTIRADIVDVYILKRWPSESLDGGEVVEFLQLYRVGGSLEHTWQPVMGHIEEGETAVAAAVRELGEEVGLSRAEMRGFWALEQVHPFFIARRDEIVSSPRFVVEVGTGWVPRLNEEHSEFRWISGHQAARYFMWPGQAAAAREILEVVVKGGLGEGWMRVD